MIQRPTIQRSLVLACLIPMLAVGGCAGTKNRGLESVHQPLVGRADYRLDLTAPGGRLATGEQQRLSGWLTSLRVGYGDHVGVDDPNGGQAAARDTVAGVVAGFGLLLSDDTPPSPAPVPQDVVRVVVSRMRAHVPGCNDWSRDSSVDYDQNTSSFYGCSINANLAVMVANPQDLIRGAGSSGINDPASSFRAIDSYRKATPSGGGGQTVKSEGVGGK